MSRLNTLCGGGAKGAPGDGVDTPTTKDLTGAGAVKGKPELGPLTAMSGVSPTYGADWGTFVSWGDVIMSLDKSGAMTPPKPVAKPEITREEFLFRYYIDLATDPWKYGSELEMEMAETQAELEELGKWAEVLSHLILLEQEKMKIEEERAAKLEASIKKNEAFEAKRREHQKKIAAMKEVAAKAWKEEKDNAAAKIAGRQVATAKNGIACRYFRDNGMPEPATNGWEPGCDYYKHGKCPCIHPDEPGWDEAVVARKAKRGASHRHVPRGAGGFGRDNAASRDTNWRDDTPDWMRAAGGGKPRRS
jgi:hypothetical protein